MRSTSSVKGARSRTTSGRSLTVRDERILEHIGRFRVSIRPIIERQFFNGASSENVLSALARDGRIHAGPRQLDGNFSWYQLTRTEAIRRNRSENIGNPLDGYGLHKALAVLWFCCGYERDSEGKQIPHERYLLDREQLAKAFNGVAPDDQDPYCVDAGDGTIYRVHVHDTAAKDSTIFRKLREVSSAAFKNAALLNPIRDGHFGYAVLVEFEERRVHLEKEIPKLELPGNPLVRVFRAPGSTTLKEFVI